MDQTPDTEDRYMVSRGVKLPKGPYLNAGRVRQLLRQNAYERKESDAAMRVVRKGDRVLELGGGIGYMSSLVAVHRAVEKIVTYEANPSLIPRIKAVHAANNLRVTELRHALLTPEGGPPVAFYERENFLASSMDYDADPDSIIATHHVPQEAIQPVITALKPTILICDIEGAEAQLLPAADWSCLRAAIIELHPQWIGPAGVRAVFDAMQDAGLTYYPKASEAKVVTFRRDW